MDRMEALRQIVEADREARERVDAAAREKESFQSRLETLSRELDEAAMRRAEADVARARAQSEADTKRALAALGREQEAALRALREQLGGREAALRERLFRAVIGSE